MVPIKLFDDFLSGQTLWSNPHYIPPAKKRAMKVGEVLQRKLVKDRAKEMIKKKKYEDEEKDNEDLFNKTDD